MPGLFGVFGNPGRELSNDELAGTIDPFLSNESMVLDLPGGKAGASWLPDDPLGKSIYSGSGESPGFFCGDLIDHREVPWEDIRESVTGGNAGWLKNLKGTFAIFLHDTRNRVLYLASDRLSQEPLYYTFSGGRFIFSTGMAAICRLSQSPKFSREWLYEFLYFNIPVGETTPLEGVKRLPPASLLTVRLDSLKSSLTSYSEPFSRPASLLGGRLGMNRALEVFSDRLPRYYPDAGSVAVSLTAGFDSRCVLSFAPKEARDRITTYTYGVPGCYDLVEAVAAAKALGFRHRSIHFDDTFGSRLEGLIRETVYLSGGLEKAHRATLAHVYRNLAGGSERFPVVLTGLSGDHLFRDHINGRGNVPSIISADMMGTIQTGEVKMNAALYSDAFGERYEDFREHIHDAIKGLCARHGALRDPAAYMRYLIYESAPKYFGGEYALARQFTAIRSPFWDSDIISLSFGIEHGTLGFSESLPVKDPYREKVLQAYLISRATDQRHHGIAGLPLSAFSSGSKMRYNAMKMIWRLPGKIGALAGLRRDVPLEDWHRWLFSAEGASVHSLLSGEPMLSEYISMDFIDRARSGDNVILLGKMITAETVLRLIASGWDNPSAA